jgi:hypothetical protein
VVTAFEIFEHLLNPYTILSEINQQDFHINTNAFVVFTSYRSKTDMWDITMNLKIGNWIGFGKIGLENYRSSKWTNPVNKIGIRPILRRFTNRYYIVYAERIK